MNLDYLNSRHAFGQREEGGGSSHPPGRQHSYEQESGSMRGNDYFSTEGYNSDYSRGNYSASTYGAGRNEGGYAASKSGTMDKTSVEFPDYSNRPTYGSYAGSQQYTNFIDHNYGYSWAGLGGSRYSSSSYSPLEEKRQQNMGGHRTKASGTRTPFRSANQSRYGENDGRRR